MTMTNNYLCPWYAINMTSVPQVTTFYFWCVNWCAAYLQNMPGAQVLDRCAKKFPYFILMCFVLGLNFGAFANSIAPELSSNALHFATGDGNSKPSTRFSSSQNNLIKHIVILGL